MRQTSLFDANSADDDTGGQAAEWVLPDLMEVMDLQQEQVARTLGEGHRVIHGAAGSGKTMILIFRAQQLAAAARPEKPILVLCYNRALCERIDAMLRERDVDERVVVRTFHSWCQDLKRSYQLAVPQGLSDNAYYAALSDTVCRSVETGLVPGGQYTALLIDEAHDFQDAWLQMAARMVDASSQSLLVLYDDAQSIYQKKRKKFNFASLGIQAQGRTSVLRLNYRNTAEVLALAMHCAQGLLAERAESDEAMRTVHPASAGRRGPLPVLVEAANQDQEARAVAGHVAQALADGVAPADIVILARTRYQLAGIALALRRQGTECRSMSDAGQRMDWAARCVKLLTMHSAKGLEFPLVYVVGLQVMPLKEEPMEEEVRLLYVAMTRATQRLVLSAAGPSPMLHRVRNSLEAVRAHFATHSV
jgi:superfamily I DNA/RNA helicase